jgi:hypothetical protein
MTSDDANHAVEVGRFVRKMLTHLVDPEAFVIR